MTTCKTGPGPDTGDVRPRVNIDLGDGHRITADRYQWILQRFQGYRDDGTERWESEGYFADLGQLLKAHAHRCVRLAEASTLADVCRNLENACAALTRACTGIVEIAPGFRAGGDDE